MNTPFTVILSPRQLELNEILTVRSASETFPENDYQITDEKGRLIRKGPISRGINEFKLCIVGLKTGEYRLSMGQIMEKFTVI